MKIPKKRRGFFRRILVVIVVLPLLTAFTYHPINSTASSEVVSEEGWTLIAEKGDVKMYAQSLQCGADEQFLYLMKLVNSNKLEDVTVEYTINVTNSPTEGVRNLTTTIAKNSSLEGSCENVESFLKAYMVSPDDGFQHLEVMILTIKTNNHEK